MSRTRETPPAPPVLPTDRGRETPTIRQVSVFTDNRVGALAELFGIFDHTTVHIMALSVIQGFDCAIVRFIFSDTDAAARSLAASNHRFTICDLLAVSLPEADRGLGRAAKALLAAEISINYCYALLPPRAMRGAVAIHVDDPALASTVLEEAGFKLIDENELHA
jgi:hypothetical protein